MVSFSFVIPTFNRADLIERSLNSILFQEYDKHFLEIIVIDDGSDDTEILTRRILANKIQYSYIKNPIRLGLSRSRNLGIDLAKNDFIIFLDSDNYLVRNAISVFSKLIKSYNADILFTSNIDTVGRPISFLHFEGNRIVDYAEYFKIKGEFLPTCKSEVIKKNKFDETFDGGEGAMWVQLIEKYKVLYSDFIASHYNVASTDRLSTQAHNLTRARRMKRIYFYDFSKNWKIYIKYNCLNFFVILFKLCYYNLLNIYSLIFKNS